MRELVANKIVLGQSESNLRKLFNLEDDDRRDEEEVIENGGIGVIGHMRDGIRK